MARYTDYAREALAPTAQAIFDTIAESRANVRGPYTVLMQVPPLAERVAHLGTYLRFGGLLPAVDRELAICVAAREMGSRYEWFAHAPLALRAGARPEAVEAIRAQGPSDSLTRRERLIVDVVLAMYRQRALSDDLFERARSEFGQDHLVELVTLAGYYGMIAFVLLAFEVPLPAGATAAF